MSLSDLETLDLLSTPSALEEIRRAEADLAAGHGIDADELLCQLAARAEREQQRATRHTDFP
ncbi:MULTISPECIES: hypothetical protein [unclassified Micromonospora]|uniref:hypothetical protein n=1 Tax=unclassified Micromonospora TaxID=2617518 RepID=UPI003A876931